MGLSAGRVANRRHTPQDAVQHLLASAGRVHAASHAAACALTHLLVPSYPRVAGRKLIEYTGAQVFEAPIHSEGGSIHSDGEG